MLPLETWLATDCESIKRVATECIHQASSARAGVLKTSTGFHQKQIQDSVIEQLEVGQLNAPAVLILRARFVLPTRSMYADSIQPVKTLFSRVAIEVRLLDSLEVLLTNDTLKTASMRFGI